MYNAVVDPVADGGTVPFYLRRDFWSSSLSPTPWAYLEEVAVPRVSFDSVRERYRPTMLIVDIEGAETQLLSGIALTGIKKIYVELHQNLIGRVGMKNVFDFLSSKGSPLRPAPFARQRGAVQPRAALTSGISGQVASMALPKFLCIGAQKAGTSWLYAQLQTHPEVWMPPVKELQFFNHLYVPAHRAWTTWHIRQGAARALAVPRRARPRPRTSATCATSPTSARASSSPTAGTGGPSSAPRTQGKLVGEITPEYSTIPEAGIRHVRALLGAVRVIYLIRAPVSRALSQLQMNLSRKGNARPGRGAVDRGDQPATS